MSLKHLALKGIKMERAHSFLEGTRGRMLFIISSPSLKTQPQRTAEDSFSS
jgi:hypothetical protein